MLKSDVVSTLKSDVVSTLKSDVVSTLKSDVVSTLKSDVVSTLKSDVVSTLKSDTVSTLCLGISMCFVEQKKSLLYMQSSPRSYIVLATAWGQCVIPIREEFSIFCP